MTLSIPPNPLGFFAFDLLRQVAALGPAGPPVGDRACRLQSYIPYLTLARFLVQKIQLEPRCASRMCSAVARKDEFKTMNLNIQIITLALPIVLTACTSYGPYRPNTAGLERRAPVKQAYGFRQNPYAVGGGDESNSRARS